MPNDSAVSGPPLAMTSPNGRRASKPKSEAAFLRAEAADARSAIAGALEDLRDGLGEAADIRVWTQEHPWAATGTAAAAGFALAAMMVPRPDQTWADKIAALKPAPESIPKSAQAASAAAREAPGDGQPTVLQAALSGLFDLAGAALSRWLLASLQGQGPGPAEANGAGAVAQDEVEDVAAGS
jgi:hypothetical protein